MTQKNHEITHQKINFSNIEEYIVNCPLEVQPRLREVYSVISAALPQAGQKISWGMPTFFLGKNRVHFAAQKKHVGLYPGVAALEHYAPRLAEYKTGKGSIQFPYAKPLPAELISEIAVYAIEGRDG